MIGGLGVAGAGTWSRRRVVGGATACEIAAALAGVPVQRPRHCGHDRDRGCKPFSVPAAAVTRSGVEPDGVGCIIVDVDTVGDDDRNSRASADRAGVTPRGCIVWCADR
jgi:hypothetical protein